MKMLCLHLYLTVCKCSQAFLLITYLLLQTDLSPTLCSHSSFMSTNKVLIAGEPFCLQHLPTNVYYTPSPQWKLSLFNYSFATGWETCEKKIICWWKEATVWSDFKKGDEKCASLFNRLQLFEETM